MENLQLPSHFKIGDKVDVHFVNSGVIINAEVIQVHFTIAKVKYDLEVCLKAGTEMVHERPDQPAVEREVKFYTRVYNLDSALLTEHKGQSAADVFMGGFTQENFESKSEE